MDFFQCITMCGGLALFLYGMSMLSSSLKTISGGKLEGILERLTGNIFVAVLVGAVVTALIQSSSATTVIVVGLVNAKSLKLKNAVGVIMGANIGTTVTGQLLRMSEIGSDNLFLQLLKPTTLAPIAATIGILLLLASKKSIWKSVGNVLLGFGILFTGMFTMEGAVSSLKEMPQFAQLFASMSNPVLGVLVGTGVTALIQSSSASVGILQALSTTGVITYSTAFPIIMGQNIGTCVTSLLACIGTSKNAKRSAVVHLMFNIIGTILFLIVVYTIQSLIGFPFWEQPINMGGIANVHTFFNVVTTLVFIPFAGLLEKLACLIMRDKKDEKELPEPTIALESRLLSSPGLALEQSRHAVSEVARMGQRMLDESIALLDRYDQRTLERIKDMESSIDKIDDRLSLYLHKLSNTPMNDDNRMDLTKMLHMASDVEQIGDCVLNIAECGTELYENKADFSESAKTELGNLFQATQEMLSLTIEMIGTEDSHTISKAEALEDVIDTLEATLKEQHINRLRDGKCSTEVAFIFINVIAQCERIADYCSKIGVCLLAYDSKHSESAKRHEFSRKIHDGQIEGYNKYATEYRTQYLKGF